LYQPNGVHYFTLAISAHFHRQLCPTFEYTTNIFSL
jgi:hypothetical protein